MANEKDPQDPSRRKFIKYGVAAAGVAALGLAGYSLLGKKSIQDYTITSTIEGMITQTTETRVLGEPERLFDFYISEGVKAYPELFKEMKKLPDLYFPANGQPKVNAKNIEAVKNILELAKDDRYKQAFTFESILNEGIKDKRKYCTPLEALLWCAYDNLDLKNLLAYHVMGREYLIEKLVKTAWRDTSTSQNYASDRWKNFDEVVDRLNSPRLVCVYMEDNIKYGGTAESISTRWWKTPEETFKDKIGYCYDQAAFALHCLAKNGHSNFKILFVRCGDLNQDSSGNGHAVCMQEEGTRFYTIDNGKLKGPFSTLDEVIASASQSTKERRVRAYRFFYYDSIPYHRPYGEIYYGT